MYALVDCNNFYASCERLFRPDLKHKPIIVLSSNDGCVIARSNEAKALGIKMGVPFFKVASLCRTHKVQIFSSNFVLYGDLSDRVMRTIEEVWPHTEIYSIDEAFLKISSLNKTSQLSFCEDLQQTILKHTGIPTSIGIGPTKTLAKLANFLCKRRLHIPVFELSHPEKWLSQIPVNEVWGVGHGLTDKLEKLGIFTAYDLSVASIKGFSLPLKRTIMELNGIPSVLTDSLAHSKSIISSKSVTPPLIHYEELAQALSSHCRTAYQKLRNQQLTTQHMQIFIRTSPFQTPYYANTIACPLPEATDNLAILTHTAKINLKKIYREGFQYKKIGICLTELHSLDSCQYTLFSTPEASPPWLDVFDSINKKFGRHTIKLAAEGSKPPLIPAYRSPAYTTCWEDLPIAFCRGS